MGLLVDLSKSPSPVLPMLVVTSTVLSPRPLPEECSTPLLTLLPTLLLPSQPLLPPRKLSTSNLPLLLPSTTFRGSRPRLVLSLSPSSLLDLVKVRVTLGCVRLPLSTQSLQLSELWRKVTLPPMPPQLFQLVNPPFGAHSLLLSS